MATSPLHILVIGSGRWARQMLETLHATFPVDKAVFHILSLSQPQAIETWTAQLCPKRKIQIYNQQDAIDTTRIDATFITNAAAQHTPSALWSLAHGLPTAVEKPLALTPSELDTVLQCSLQQNCLLWPQLVLCHEAFIQHFTTQFAKQDVIRSIHIDWHDALAETRYGEVKSYDANLSLPQDVAAHIWSILQHFFPIEQWRVSNCTVSRGGRHVRFMLHNTSGTKITCDLQRETETRQRKLTVHTAKDCHDLHFAQQRAEWSKNGEAQTWPETPLNAPRPLAAAMGAFLDAVKHQHHAATYHDVIKACGAFQFLLQQSYVRARETHLANTELLSEDDRRYAEQEAASSNH